MTDAIIEFFRNTLNNDVLTIFIISMLPIVELRGSIPIGIGMGLDWYVALGYAFLGSIIVVPFLLLLLMPILNLMKKNKWFKKVADVVEGVFKGKAEKITKRIGSGDTEKREMVIKMLGVLTFVAIPMPMTGVWTGTAVAVFLGLGFWKSLLVISLGNMSAGLIMTGLSLLLQDYIDLFLTIFMIVILVVLVLNILYAVIKHHLKNKAKSAEIDDDESDKSEIIADETVDDDMRIDENERVNDDDVIQIDENKRVNVDDIIINSSDGLEK